MPDLVFYLLKAVLSRVLGTGSIKAVSELLPRIREALENDYIGILKWKISEVYRASGVVSTSAQTEKAERERRFSFVVSKLAGVCTVRFNNCFSARCF